MFDFGTDIDHQAVAGDSVKKIKMRPDLVTTLGTHWWRSGMILIFGEVDPALLMGFNTRGCCQINELQLENMLWSYR